MRIYDSAYELISEMGRNIWEMGTINKPKTYQNKNIEGNEDYITKELICEQYALVELPDPDNLFKYTHSREWADKEFKERVNQEYVENPGNAWLDRKEVWEQFLNSEGEFDYTYGQRMIGALNNIIYLLRSDFDTRKAVLPIFNGNGYCDTNYLDGYRRIPCSMYYDFLIRENFRGEKQLNITYHQRSSDFIVHFGNDVYLAWKLMLFVSNAVGVKPGYLYHTIDSIHVYKKDWDILKNSMKDYNVGY